MATKNSIPTNDKELAALLMNDPDIASEVSKASGKSLGKDALKKYARELQQDIKNELRKYYNSYTPTVYQRNKAYNALLNSMIINPPNVEVSTKKTSITITFDSRAYGESLFNPKHTSFKAALINEGWHVNSSYPWSDIEHFGYFDGAHFIEAGISKFKKKHPEVSITLTKSLGDNNDVIVY